MTTPAFYDTDFFLGQLPEGNYQQFVAGNLPQERRRHFRDMFSDIQKEYNKALAGFAAQNRGKSPTTKPELETFSNFLRSFSFDDKFYESAPWERDRNYDAFNPRTRFDF